MALSIVCCLCLFHHLPSVFFISHILFTYCMRENKSLTLSNLCGINVWTLRIKSKVPVGTELKSKVSPDFIMPFFLLNIDAFFPHFSLKPVVSCIIDSAAGTYAMLGSMSCLACEETDWSWVKCFCFPMWYRYHPHNHVRSIKCFCSPVKMGAKLSKSTLEVNDYHVVL